MVAHLLIVLLVKEGTQKKYYSFQKKVIAFDRDQKSKLIADKFKKRFKDRFEFYNKRFSEIDLIKTSDQVKGIVFDLGFSYNQIKDLLKDYHLTTRVN